MKWKIFSFLKDIQYAKHVIKLESKKKISLKASDTFEIIIKKINENNEYKRNFDQLSENERNLLLNMILK